MRAPCPRTKCHDHVLISEVHLHILVIGAGGMLGAKLITRLCAEGVLASQQISRLTRYDAVIPPPPPASAFPVETFVGDLSATGEAERLIATKPDVIFHLAAIVSGEAEKDFEKGYRINLDA